MKLQEEKTTPTKSIVISYIKPTVIEEQDRLIEIEDYGKVILLGRQGPNIEVLKIWTTGQLMSIVKITKAQIAHEKRNFSSKISEREIINFCKRQQEVDTISREEYEQILKDYVFINFSTERKED